MDLAVCRRTSDFGRGLYASTSLAQARAFACDKAGRHGGGPAVVRFRLDRRKVASLVGLSFVRGDRDALDYWRFVHHCRRGGAHSPDGLEAAYDVVAGPVAKAFRHWDRREVWSDYDQFSFHTPRAAALLDEADKEVEQWQDGQWTRMPGS